METAGAAMVLVVHECVGLAALTLGKPAAPGSIAAGGLPWPPGKYSKLWLLYSAGGCALSSPLATTKGGRQSLRLAPGS